jgi:hypothetical protein
MKLTSRVTSDSWTKSLLKSGTKFEHAMQYLEGIQLPQRAAMFSNLQKRIIQHQLHLFRVREDAMRSTVQVENAIPQPFVTSSTYNPLGYQPQYTADISGHVMHGDGALSEWGLFQPKM